VLYRDKVTILSPLGTTIASAKLDFWVTSGVPVALWHSTWHWWPRLPVVSTFLY